jgi:hypothetical protein
MNAGRNIVGAWFCAARAGADGRASVPVPSQVAGATPPIFAETLNRWIFLALLTRPGKR